MKKINQSKGVEKIIESDRVGLSVGAEDIIKGDIVDVLKEYFVLKKTPNIGIYANGKNIEISIRATAEGVKKFQLLK